MAAEVARPAPRHLPRQETAGLFVLPVSRTPQYTERKAPPHYAPRDRALSTTVLAQCRAGAVATVRLMVLTPVLGQSCLRVGVLALVVLRNLEAQCRLQRHEVLGEPWPQPL